MFDIGFLELLICAVIALLVLGPERLPTAARAAGRWIGAARRMVGQFTSELDRQLKADELREELRKAGDVGLDDVQKTVRDALDEAKQYEHMILPDSKTEAPRPAPATRRSASQASDQPLAPPASPTQRDPEPSQSPEPGNTASPGSEPGSSDKHS
ncbi:twin-arginine translocase subunit TatB [Marinobacter salinisoli]|uniref:Sec-independent protein translocase protein TatB n=1 Tax=Marinobacter salinisoli TaxID=2769486 RepID=A0ABX7MVL3_9GAMM|nr:Sec-independent protein translocase protein TatB [Marinobacter salinisoli]QSP95141.1 twin-arginine translocase subunit TatB [Marinobacter salinisoli]